MRRRLGAAVAGAVAAAALSGCSAHPTININGGAINGCYRAYPVAVSALHSTTRPQFKGVRRLAADALEKKFPTITVPQGESDRVVCAFAFHDTNFHAGQVEAAPANEQGSYAVVLVTSKHLRVIRSYVGDSLPERFSHRLAT